MPCRTFRYAVSSKKGDLLNLSTSQDDRLHACVTTHSLRPCLLAGTQTVVLGCKIIVLG